VRIWAQTSLPVTEKTLASMKAGDAFWMEQFDAIPDEL
jgi:hypothetical protein